MQKELPPYLRRSATEVVIERDVDLMILCHLIGSPELVRHFMTRCGLPDDFRLLNAWHSVVDCGTETDLLLLFEGANEQRRALLVENKIDAMFQLQQAERCRARGEAGVTDGHWDSYLTVLLAPADYMRPMIGNTSWDMHIAYEDIATDAENALPLHQESCFLAEVLRTAATKFSKGGFIVNQAATDFWRCYADYCADRFPKLEIAKLNPHQSRNEPWPAFQRSTLGSDVLLEHKPRNGVVDLTVSKATVDHIRQRFPIARHERVTAVKVGRSAALRIRVKPIDHLLPFGEQEHQVEEALAAVHTLSNIARGRLHPEQIDALVSSVTEIIRALNMRLISASDGPHSARVRRVCENLISYVSSARFDLEDDRLCHIVSRIGVWSRSAAMDLESGWLSVEDAVFLLRQLAALGDAAFEAWLEGSTTKQLS